MKKLFLFLFVALALTASLPAHAILSDGRIERIIRIDAETCGIEIAILEDDGLLPALTKLEVGDHLLSTLEALIDLDLGLGDYILAATVTLEEESGINADVHIEGVDCEELRPGNVVRLLRGLLGTVVHEVTIPEGFGDLSALELDPHGDGILLVKLDEVAVTVSNSDGDSGSVGGGNGSSSGGTSGGSDSGSSADDGGATVGPLDGAAASTGGCSMASGPGSVAGYGFWLTLLNGFIALRCVRNRKRT